MKLTSFKFEIVKNTRIKEVVQQVGLLDSCQELDYKGVPIWKANLLHSTTTPKVNAKSGMIQMMQANRKFASFFPLQYPGPVEVRR